MPFALCHSRRDCIPGIPCTTLRVCDLAVTCGSWWDHSLCIWKTKLQTQGAHSFGLKGTSRTPKLSHFIWNVTLVCAVWGISWTLPEGIWGGRESPPSSLLHVCDGQLAGQLQAQLTLGASWPSLPQTMHWKVKGALALTLNKCVWSPGVPLTIGQQADHANNVQFP